MKIKLDEKFGRSIKVKMIEFMDKQQQEREDDGLMHVSDLLNPRWAFFVRTEGWQMTEEDVGMFMPGIAFHELLQKVLGEEMAEQKLNIVKGVVGTADMVGTFFSEIKTSRKWTIPEMPDDHYIEQFLPYMVGAKRKTGHIVVVYFTAGRTWAGDKPSNLEIVSWKVTASTEDLKNTKNLMEQRRDMLSEALEGRVPLVEMPLCWKFKCASVYKGKITKLCPFYYKCQPEGRYPTELLTGATKKPSPFKKRK